MAVAGLGNGIAQYWWTRSLSLAPPSAVVPFNYLSLVWATLLGLAIWGDVPTPHLLLGAVVVVCSGLYILWRETLRRGGAAAAPAPRRYSGTRPDREPQPLNTDTRIAVAGKPTTPAQAGVVLTLVELRAAGRTGSRSPTTASSGFPA